MFKYNIVQYVKYRYTKRAILRWRIQKFREFTTVI